MTSALQLHVYHRQALNAEGREFDPRAELLRDASTFVPIVGSYEYLLLFAHTLLRSLKHAAETPSITSINTVIICTCLLID